MATLNDIANLVVCGLAAVLGTGTKGCKAFFKKVTAIWLLPQGFELDGTQTLNITYVESLQVDGNLLVLKGVRTFTDNTPDDSVEELEDGTKQLARLGLYEFAVQFINGLFYHAALHSLSGFGDYDALFIDRDGSILGTMAASGNLKGFTLGMVQADKFKFATDTEGQKEGFMFQLLERPEFDNDYVYIDGASLDFNPNRIDGINEVYVEFDGVPAAGTSVTIKMKTRQGGKAYTGEVFTNLLMTKNGATSNPTADDSEATGAGTYVLTVPSFAGSDDLTARLYDNSGNKAVIKSGGAHYKSNVAAATAV